MRKTKFLGLFLAVILVLVACTQKTENVATGNGGTTGTAGAANSATTESDYPKEPIRMIIPYNPGGAIDTTGRILAETVSKKLDKSEVVVINKAGGGGTVGTTEVFSSKPDGYTIGYVPLSTLAIQPHLGTTKYTYNDLDLIMRVGTNPQVLVVPKNSPWENFDQWLEYVKNNPGKFTYGTGGKGSLQHVTMEALSNEANIEMKMVPFNSGAEIMAALLGGHVNGAVVYPSDVEANKDDLRVLVYFGDGTDDLKNEGVPSIADKGIQLQVGHNLYALIAPKGLPEDVLKKLDEAFKVALEEPELISKFNDLGVTPSYSPSEELQKELTTISDSIGEILKQLENVQ